VFDGENILLETDGTNLSQAVYTLEPLEYGKLISQRQNQSGTWVSINYSFDGLGSTDSLTDGNQVITDTYTYYAFGLIKASSGTTTNGFTWVGELGYVRDTETGEYELSVRQYFPDRARFKSQDPLGLDPDINLYRYVDNNCTCQVDPSGLQGIIAGLGFPCLNLVNGTFKPDDDALVKSTGIYEHIKFAIALSGDRHYAQGFNARLAAFFNILNYMLLVFAFLGAALVIQGTPAAVVEAIKAYLIVTFDKVVGEAIIAVFVANIVALYLSFLYLAWQAVDCHSLDIAARAYGAYVDACWDFLILVGVAVAAIVVDAALYAGNLASAIYQGNLRRLMGDHLGKFNGQQLTQINAEFALTGPSQTAKTVVGGQGVEGADVTFFDYLGRLLYRREVETSTGSETSIYNALRRGAPQVEYDGDVLIQVPKGTEVPVFTKFFQRRAQAAAEHSSKFRKVRVIIRDTEGSTLFDGPVTGH
jgi:RHS repeat-associated protein